MSIEAGDGMRRPFTIAHISDIHCGGPYFVPNLMERAITEINDLAPDIVVCSGDLTTFGFKPEYQQASSTWSLRAVQARSSVPGCTIRVCASSRSQVRRKSVEHCCAKQPTAS